jgi:toxin ParE1/3/4
MLEKELHPLADEEVVEAAVFYNVVRQGLGDDFLQPFDRAVEAIRRDPMRWPVREFGTRRYVMRRFPYAIRYLIKPELVFVVAVAHTSREPGYWKDRVFR